MIEVGILKTVLSWASIPITALLAALGFQYKKIVSRIENLESEMTRAKIATAKAGVEITHIKYQMQRIDDKLDKILEFLRAPTKR